MAPIDHPDLLVGVATSDDAAVWRIDDGRALVFTADFITPVVDDARSWGRIAAVNAISDVYAMGGKPLIALNLVGWNTEQLSTDLLGDVRPPSRWRMLSRVAGAKWCGCAVAAWPCS